MFRVSRRGVRGSGRIVSIAKWRGGEAGGERGRTAVVVVQEAVGCAETLGRRGKRGRG